MGIHPTALRPPIAVLALASVLLPAGCDAPPAVGSIAWDSAGIRIVENREPEWGLEETWRLGEPSLDLGGAEAAGPTAFQYVVDAFFAAGSLVVVESGGDVHFFDAEGAAVGFAGGVGDGPGEFRMVAGAGAMGDTIWAYDYSHRRLTYFDVDGELLSVHALEGEDATLMPVGRLGDGFLLGSTYRPGAAAEAGRLGLRRDTVEYRVFGPRGQRSPPIGRGAAREYVVGEEDGRLTMATPPFARRAHDGSDGSVWVHGDQASRTLRIRDPGGGVRTLVRWPGPDLAVTDEAVRGEIERRIQRYNEDEAGLRRFFTELPHPDRRPAHGRVHLDPDGHIWVETAPGPARDDDPFETPGWHVFAPDGRWLGTVASPGGLRITQILPDRVVGVWQDAMDVEHVQVRPLIRPDGQPGD